MSQTETEHFSTLVRQTRNVANSKGRLIEKATRFLRPKERKQREQEKAQIDEVLKAPSWVTKDLTQQGKAQLLSRSRALDDDLEENSPPPVSGDTKDALNARLKEINENIRGGMPTQEVMRRNPPGAVDMHERWMKRTKDMQIERKNILKLLDPENDDKDYCNVEMIRPAGITQDMAATFMMGAQIPGNFAMTPLAKANWPVEMPEYGTANSVMAQMEKREQVEAQPSIDPKIAELEAENRKLKDQLVSKAEARAALQKQTKENREKQRERMKEYWKQKKAAQRGEEIKAEG